MLKHYLINTYYEKKVFPYFEEKKFISPHDTIKEK